MLRGRMKPRRLAAAPIVALLLIVGAVPALAEGPVAHVDPTAALALALAVVLLGAKLFGDLAMRVGQPAVLGELVAGVVLGNAVLLGVPWFEPLKADPALDLLARLGVVMLLFRVGLESTVAEMLAVGWASLAVATLGVVVPFGLGWLVGAWLLPASGPYVHAFLGAALSATSVGITARVLSDLGRSKSAEARIILGAAVIDDVLGLVLLAVVGGVVAAADRGASASLGSIAIIVLKSAGFLFASLIAGVWASPRLFRVASRLKARGVLLAVGLSICLLFSWAAGAAGLAPIVGAFAAGLVLEDVHYQDFTSRGEHGLEELVEPITSFLAPVFFVMMGLRTDLGAFVGRGVPLLAAALTIAAIVGKQAAMLGTGRGVDRLTVGLGMVPRGEVGLIFANMGMTLTLGGAPLFDRATYSAIVVMVIATTFVAPPALKWSLRRAAARAA
jgi:Kef-type K+ transport system membrane component KefB